MLWPEWLLLLVGVLSLLTDALETDHLVSATVWDWILAISHDLLITVNTVICCYATSFLPARRYASAGYRDRNVSVRPSVRLSVRHAPVLCHNEES